MFELNIIIGRSQPLKKEATLQRIVRVHNGWPKDQDPEYRYHPVVPTTKSAESLLCKIEVDVMMIFDHDKVRHSISLGLQTLGEHKLYDVVYNRERKDTFINERVSRHMFHLFLRQCTAKDRLFK